jgi:Protein of unknown function (DUF2924)
MEQAIADEVEQLARMPVGQLRARYREVYGEDSSSRHKQHLVRRIAWRLQVLALGDLTERAARRAREIANDADLKMQVPRAWTGSAGTSVPTSRRDRRLPIAGTVLRRAYRERAVEVKVLAEGFEYEGHRYESLSAVARAITGTRWNGLLFFGLSKRRKARAHGGRRTDG